MKHRSKQGFGPVINIFFKTLRDDNSHVAQILTDAFESVEKIVREKDKTWVHIYQPFSRTFLFSRYFLEALKVT